MDVVRFVCYGVNRYSTFAPGIVFYGYRRESTDKLTIQTPFYINAARNGSVKSPLKPYCTLQNITNPRHFGLRAKLVALVVTGIVVAFSIIGGFRIYQEKQRIATEIQRSGQERAALISEAVANLIIGYDYSNLESLAERIVKQQDVQQIVIRNREGKAMVTRNSSVLRTVDGLPLTSIVTFSGAPIGQVELLLSLQRLEQEINAMVRSILLEQLFFGFFLGLLIYLGASQVIVEPISHFRTHMHSIISSPDEEFPKKLDISSRDEIGELARIFNDMNQRVYEIQRRLRDKISLADTELIATNEQLMTRSTELEDAFALMEKLAITDSLTLLYNRRHFDDCLAAAFSRAQRHQEPVCLILLDVDHFKHVNDSLGHAAGDYVLQELGRLIKSRIRETDTAARPGGDEFALLLYHTDKVGAKNLADDLLLLTRVHQFVFNGSNITATFSIGIALLETELNDVKALYAAADSALYEAKRRGRNQLVVYPFQNEA